MMRGGQGGVKPDKMEELWAAVCDLCHWPYVYQDKDIMAAEKCEYCPVIRLLKEMRKENSRGHEENDA